MLTMTAYKVRIDESAERDILELTAFLTSVMSRGLANIFHIEDDTVIIDRIRSTKLIKR